MNPTLTPVPSPFATSSIASSSSSSGSSLGVSFPSAVPSEVSTPTGMMTTAPAADHHPRWSPWPSWPRSWSGSRTSKHTRVRRACDSCRSRKTGCSGDDPCKSCSRLNRSCVYTEVSEEQARAARDRKNNLKARRGDIRSEVTEIGDEDGLLVKGWSPQNKTFSPFPDRRSPPRQFPSVLQPSYFAPSPRPPSFSSSSCSTTTATASTATFLPTPSPLSSTLFDSSRSPVQTDKGPHLNPHTNLFSPEASHPQFPDGSRWSSHFPRSPEQDSSRWSSSVRRSPESEKKTHSRPLLDRTRRPAHSWSISSIHSIFPPSSLSSSSSSSSLSPCPSPLTWPGVAPGPVHPDAYPQLAHRPGHRPLRTSRSSPAAGFSTVPFEEQTNHNVPILIGPGLGLGLNLGTGFDIDLGLQSMSVRQGDSGLVESTYKLWGAD
ncbi:Zn(2)-C6 fungal-type DNA-binding domain [Phaffia rhodozyma]|uniref:Zn(2)-C6 fungal-type DNA-binding domain n=1 Tax=Phaffia rhodozyma TaxID=264483 RepID=A0A0F7SE60_PHARH|nr:Zn(2)-C6 fungal-type DNA-binding domain [Phaffia rhodozyma]